MENPIIIEKVYNVPITKIWQALTREDEVRKWYFPQLVKFKPLAGFEFVFDNDGSPYQKEWRVTKVKEGSMLAHSWAYRGYPGNSEVTFELFEMDDQTRIRLTHTGIASFPTSPHFARHRFEEGWENILGTNLKNHLERNTADE